MGSRVRDDPDKIFEMFAEIARPTDSGEKEPFILQKYPENYDEEDVIKSIPAFAFPCDIESTMVDHFTFVLTDIESKYRFGFCRHATGAQTCLCIISCLPWYEIFYKLLNYLAEILNRTEGNNVAGFMQALYEQEVPSAGLDVDVTTKDFKQRFSFKCPDARKLPTIPESRNLTEYYNAVDGTNMMIIFASMLAERRILITSKKLSRLTACVHGSAALIYPMHWQHLYIPVLPIDLIDYCSAPMPYLIGIHSSLLEKAKKNELGDSVILDADNNTVYTEHNDLECLPPEIVSTLKKRLKAQQSEKMKSSLMGDGVSRAFLKALVALIGGYRDGLRFRPGEQITFEPELFIHSRPASMQPFLEGMLHLQTFEQFINDRLDLLNAGVGFSDEFEEEANMWADRLGTNSRYKEWLANMKKQGKKIRREGKDKWSEFTTKVKHTGKKAYKDIRSKIDEIRKEDEIHGPDGAFPRTRPATIPVPGLKSERPPRPPPPNLRNRVGQHQRHTLQRRASYEKAMEEEVVDGTVVVRGRSRPVNLVPFRHRTRQYKVLNLEDNSGNHSATSKVGNRTSVDDSEIMDINYQRESLNLMDDPDIQQVFKKSYSMEDLDLITPDTENEEDNLNDFEEQGSTPSLAGSGSLMGNLDSITPVPQPRRRASADARSSSSAWAFSDASSGSGDSSDNIVSDTSQPLPQPRKSVPRKDSNSSLLIKLDSVEEPKQESIKEKDKAGLPAAPQGNPPHVQLYKRKTEFDPVEMGFTDLAIPGSPSQRGGKAATIAGGSVSSMLYKHSLSAGPVTGVLDDSEVPSSVENPKPKPRVTVTRQPAFYNQQKPMSLRNRTSTAQATDAQTIKDARKNFMESQVTKQVTHPLESFDPLLSGQIALDSDNKRHSFSGAGSLGGGVSFVQKSPGQGTVSASSSNLTEQDDNLLKEWNLNFDKIRVSAERSPPPIPPKPQVAPSPGPGAVQGNRLSQSGQMNIYGPRPFSSVGGVHHVQANLGIGRGITSSSSSLPMGTVGMPFGRGMGDMGVSQRINAINASSNAMNRTASAPHMSMFSSPNPTAPNFGTNFGGPKVSPTRPLPAYNQHRNVLQPQRSNIQKPEPSNGLFADLVDLKSGLNKTSSSSSGPDKLENNNSPAPQSKWETFD